MNLPFPPFDYRSVRAVFVVLESEQGGSEQSAIFMGDFPDAPTGKFCEYWELTRPTKFSSWDINTILVNNVVRCNAGIKHWGMPKTLTSLQYLSNDNSLSIAKGANNITALHWDRMGVETSSSISLRTNSRDIYARLMFQSSNKLSNPRLLSPHFKQKKISEALFISGHVTLTKPEFYQSFLAA